MSTDKLDALERLMRLRDAGALSEDEFQAEKKALLAKEATNSDMASSREPSAGVTDDDSGNASEPNSFGRANTPVWSRTKRSHGRVQGAILFTVLFAAVLGGALWFLNQPDQTSYSFMATGPANVRDAPSSTEGRVVGQLAEGDFVTGKIQGAGDKQWVEVSEGVLRGQFIWAGNLAAEGPDEVISPAREANIEGMAIRASLPPGKYSHYSDGSGNSTQDQISSVCLGAEMRSTRMDSEYRRRPPIPLFGLSDVEAKFADRSEVASFRTRLDSQQRCVADMRWSGSQDGSSVDARLSCFVTAVEVDGQGTVFVAGFDFDGCG